MRIKNKRGMQLAISTIILLVIGVLVLIGLISMLVMGWDDFKNVIKAAFGSDTAKAQRACKIQCELGNTADYCSPVSIGENAEPLPNCNAAEVKPADCGLTC